MEEERNSQAVVNYQKFQDAEITTEYLLPPWKNGANTIKMQGRYTKRGAMFFKLTTNRKIQSYTYYWRNFMDQFFFYYISLSPQKQNILKANLQQCIRYCREDQKSAKIIPGWSQIKVWFQISYNKLNKLDQLLKQDDAKSQLKNDPVFTAILRKKSVELIYQQWTQQWEGRETNKRSQPIQTQNKQSSDKKGEQNSFFQTIFSYFRKPFDQKFSNNEEIQKACLSEKL